MTPSRRARVSTPTLPMTERPWPIASARTAASSESSTACLLHRQRDHHHVHVRHRGRACLAHPADTLLISHLSNLDHTGLACRRKLLGSRLPSPLRDHFFIDLRDDQDRMSIPLEESGLADDG